MKIQQQLATRLYELLPEKKELAFGCVLRQKVNVGFDEYVTIVTLGEKETFLIENDGSIYSTKNSITDAKYEIIGQKLGLADLLMAMSRSKVDLGASVSFRGDYCHLFPQGASKKEEPIPNTHVAVDTRQATYNLSKDNILDQSDKFCEFVLELLK